MPRSSRSKSHKQSKHSSVRDYSGSDDEDVKVKNGDKEDVISVRVSGDRRKHSKDLLNGGGSDDRWNGGSSDDKGLGLNMDDKELSKSKEKDLSKSVGAESKSKSSRRHDGDSLSLIELDKDGNRGEKRKSEKEKEHKESKDKDRGSDRGRKSHSDKVEAEALSKQVENHSSKRGKEISEWPIDEELRNPELEKELEKRMRRRGEASSEKDKYQDDTKEMADRQLSTRHERSKDERHKNEESGDIRETRKKDEKYKEDSERDRKNRDVKHRGESGKYSKHRDGKYHEDKYGKDGNKETKYKDHKDDKYMESSDKDKDERSRDRKRRQDDDRDYRHKEEKRARDSKYRDVSEAKRSRDDNVGIDLYPRKTNNPDGSPVYDDRVSRSKDDKDRRGNEKDESSDYRPRSSLKEQRSESEKRPSAKTDLVLDLGRPSSRYADVEITTSHSRRRSSPTRSSYPTRDHHRFSKQEDSKYRDYAYEDRARSNVHSSRDYDSAPGQSSDKKVTSKDDGYTGGSFSGDKRPRAESRTSPQVDKSPSSSSNERRNLIKSDARRSLDLEDLGPRSGSKDTVKDGRESREFVNEAHPNNDLSVVDNDNVSVSSPYMRNSYFSGNSKSLLPPPSPSTFRTGSDGPYLGSTEDDRSKSSIRHRRMPDPNMNRGQSQNQGNWNNVQNWPSPMTTSGYIPFQHVPPPMFHPIMQQYPPQMFGRPPMKLNPGLPYSVPEHGRPPLHGWDANNAVFGDESHIYGRLDWDPRTQLNNRAWDQSGEMWKNQHAGGSMEVQSSQQKDGYSGPKSNDENWSGTTGQPDEVEHNQPDIQPETLILDKSGSEAHQVTVSPQIFEVAKEDKSALISQAYLSRVDVSKELTQPELYEQCTNMMALDQEALSDDFDCKILFLEEGVDVDVTNTTSLFSVINDSVFQKAMNLYKKQKEEFQLMNAVKENGGLDDDNFAGEVSAEVEVMEDSKEKDEPPNKSEEPMDIEADPATIVKQEEEYESMNIEVDCAAVKQEEHEALNTGVDLVVVKQEEEHESTVVAVKDSFALSADGLSPCEVENARESTNDDKNGGDSLVSSGVSTTDVAVMPTESIEFGSVNLNRIHQHSPESTH